MTEPRRRVRISYKDDRGSHRARLQTNKTGDALFDLIYMRVRERARGEIRELKVHEPDYEACETRFVDPKGVVCDYKIKPEPYGDFGLYRDGVFLGSYPDRSQAVTQIEFERMKDATHA